jgi:hypothetical protein
VVLKDIFERKAGKGEICYYYKKKEGDEDLEEKENSQCIDDKGS